MVVKVSVLPTVSPHVLPMGFLLAARTTTSGWAANRSPHLATMLSARRDIKFYIPHPPLRGGDASPHGRQGHLVLDGNRAGVDDSSRIIYAGSIERLAEHRLPSAYRLVSLACFKTGELDTNHHVHVTCLRGLRPQPFCAASGVHEAGSISGFASGMGPDCVLRAKPGWGGLVFFFFFLAWPLSVPCQRFRNVRGSSP